MSRYGLACLIGMALASSGAPCLAETASVRLKQQAELSTATYALGDISEIASADARLERRLAATPVGKTPRIGYAETVQRRTIADLIERGDPQLRAAIRWEGAEAVTVRGRGQKVSVDALLRAAVGALYAAVGNAVPHLEVDLLSNLENIHVPAGALRITPRIQPHPALSKRMCVWLDLQVDGKDYRTVPVWFAVKAFQPALVARVPLRAGDAPRLQDFATETLDVTTFGSAPLARDAPLDAVRLRKPLDAGMPLLAAHVEERPPVARNQPVEVRVTLGSIQIEIAGVALSDARLGEVVKVRNPASNDSFPATVIADGKVLIQAR
jgi:flagella basal body P-ring formation protein FlgA